GYRTPSDVVNDGLRVLEEMDKYLHANRKSVKEMIAEGLAAGRREPLGDHFLDALTVGVEVLVHLFEDPQAVIYDVAGSSVAAGLNLVPDELRLIRVQRDGIVLAVHASILPGTIPPW